MLPWAGWQPFFVWILKVQLKSKDWRYFVLQGWSLAKEKRRLWCRILKFHDADKNSCSATMKLSFSVEEEYVIARIGLLVSSVRVYRCRQMNNSCTEKMKISCSLRMKISCACNLNACRAAWVKTFVRRSINCTKKIEICFAGKLRRLVPFNACRKQSIIPFVHSLAVFELLTNP